MCGIAGFWGAPDAALLATMTSRIAHRGPDGEGFFEHPLASLGPPAPRDHRPRRRSPAGRHRRRRSCSSPTTARSTTSASCGPSSSRSGTRSTPRATPRSCCTPTSSGAPTASPASTACGRSPSSTSATVTAPRPAPRARPRPLRHQAALLRAVGLGPGALRVGSEGGARRSRARDRARPPVALRLPAARAPRPQAPDRVRGHPGAGRGDLGGGRRRRRARADLLDARRCRPTRPPIPAEFRARFERSVERRLVADVPAGTCLSGGHRLVVDRRDGEPAARRARARRGVAGRPAQDVLDRLRRRPDRRARVHGRGARRGRRRARVRGADVGAVRRRARPAWCGTRTSRSCRPARTRSGA